MGKVLKMENQYDRNKIYTQMLISGQVWKGVDFA
jgi:hypothetical protein